MSAKKKNTQKSKEPKEVSGKKAEGNAFQKLVSKIKGVGPVPLFLIGFAVSMIVFYLIYKSTFYENTLESLVVDTQAQLGSLILNLIGEGTNSAGSTISGTGFSVNVKGGCDGLEAMALLISAILVFPIGFKFKIPGLIFGGLALGVLNLVRIAGLYLAGNYTSMFWFDLLHEQGGFVLFTALSIVIWMIWAGWAMKKASAEMELQSVPVEN